MRQLNYELKQLCNRNRDGAYTTRSDRERYLTLMANQLVEMGYRQLSASSLKTKHVESLVQRWLEEGISTGAIKNRMSALRWWAEKIGKPGMISKDNDSYGIGRRQHVSNVSKARDVQGEELANIKDEHVRMSLLLQREFGLRREEAIKFRPSYADRGDRLVLKASWTKGRKEREIPIRTEGQRQVLEQAYQLAGHGSLIPTDRSYIRQLRIYERQTAGAGLNRMHGLRHQYAQFRYKEITGWEAPAIGGPVARELNGSQRQTDKRARQIVSRELGHERLQVTSVYLGR